MYYDLREKGVKQYVLFLFYTIGKVISLANMSPQVPILLTNTKTYGVNNL